MSFRALKTLVVFIFMFMSSFAFANEGGHGAEGGEGKEGKAAEKKEVKSAEESFSVVQARVQALEAKVHSGQEEIEKLIEEKRSTSDPAKVSEIVHQMNALHKEVEKNLKEYDQQRSLLKYRYPEKAAAEKREYERIELKSIDDMESQASIGSSVKKTLKKVRLQYGTPEVKKDAKVDAPKKSPGKESQPGLTDAVILKK